MTRRDWPIRNNVALRRLEDLRIQLRSLYRLEHELIRAVDRVGEIAVRRLIDKKKRHFDMLHAGIQKLCEARINCLEQRRAS